MPYVNKPNDLSKIQTKVAFNRNGTFRYTYLIAVACLDA